MDKVEMRNLWVLIELAAKNWHALYWRKGQNGQAADANPYLVLAQGAMHECASPLTRLRPPDETAYRMKMPREAETLKAEIELKPCQRVPDLKVRMKPALHEKSAKVLFDIVWEKS